MQSAVTVLANDAQEFLKFFEIEVTPDYETFNQLASQYGIDLEHIEGTSRDIVERCAQIRQFTKEVSYAVNQIAHSTEDTALAGKEIKSSIDEVFTDVEGVALMAQEQKDVVGELDGLVGLFKLDKN